MFMLLATTAAQGQNSKKPPKDEGSNTDPAPPTAPVKYHVVALNVGFAVPRSINNFGQIVGNHVDDNVAFIADVNAESLSVVYRDLNELSSGWIDMNDLEFVEGWRATIAWDINDLGEIVGTASKDGAQRGFVYSHDSKLFSLLPAITGYPDADTSARGVNVYGDICGMVWDSVSSEWLTVVWDSSGKADLINPVIPTRRRQMRISDAGVISGPFNSIPDGWFRYDIESKKFDSHVGSYVMNAWGDFAGVRKDGSSKYPNEVVGFTNPQAEDLLVIAPPPSTKLEPWINDDREVLYGEELYSKKKPNALSNRIIHRVRSGKEEYHVVSDLTDQYVNFGRGSVGVMCTSNPLVDPDGTGFGIIATSHVGKTVWMCVLIPRRP